MPHLICSLWACIPKKKRNARNFMRAEVARLYGISCVTPSFPKINTDTLYLGNGLSRYFLIDPR